MKIEHAKEVITSLKDEDKKLESFSSHKFIGRYIEKFESEYIDLLVEEKKKQDSKKTTDIFREVHSKIGSFLKRNEKELGIISDGKVTDMNIHHSETPSEKWNMV